MRGSFPSSISFTLFHRGEYASHLFSSPLGERRPPHLFNPLPTGERVGVRGALTHDKKTESQQHKNNYPPHPSLALRASVNGLLPTLKLRRTGTGSLSVLYGAHYSSHQHPSPPGVEGKYLVLPHSFLPLPIGESIPPISSSSPLGERNEVRGSFCLSPFSPVERAGPPLPFCAKDLRGIL